MRRDTLLHCFSAVLQCAGLAAAATTPLSARNTFSDTTNVDSLVEELNLDHSTETQVSRALRGYNAGHIASLGDRERASVACLLADLVLGKASGIIITETTPAYTEFVQVNWCDSCWFEPRCIAQPKSATDVSKILQIVTFLGSKFAVRSGGHNPNPGFGSIDDHGLLIDLIHLDEVTLHDDGSVVSIGPGNRAGRVYEILQAQDKTIMGPRLNHVGMGGYFLGGGLTYFSSRYGLAADNIINYEIVLANSSIVNANATHNSDLWWALKGTGANYGIVTKFDLKTIDHYSTWFEGRDYAPSQSDALLEAVVDYAHAAEKDPNAAITFALTPHSGFVEFIYGKPVERPKVYDAFKDVPYTATVFNSTIGSMADLNNAISSITPVTNARRMIGSVSFKFDIDTLRETYSLFLKTVEKAKKLDASMGFVVQPFTSAAVRHASKTGGNPTGFTPTLQNLLTFSIEWKDEADDKAALSIIHKFTDKIERIAKKHGVYIDSKAMNDAGYKQKVLKSFGAGNIAKLKRISRLYDPRQVFQKLQNNGFLLRDV